MIPTQREKLLHAIVFFVQNTKRCHKLKLYKLLHFLDFEMFRLSGSATTGLPYFAFPMGPVPAQLQGEFRNPPADMRAAMAVHIAPNDDPDRDGPLTIYPKIKFDENLFTKRELREMQRLAEIYKETDSKLISAASHGSSHHHGRPWHQVYEVEGRNRGLISYDLALDGRPGSITKEQAELIELEARELEALLR